MKIDLINKKQALDVVASVVICTYNRADNLPDALLSLTNQTFKNFEVIVVNGPSTDGTQTILDSYAPKIKIVKTQNRNLSESRNLGVREASGNIVVFIDDDAVADPRWLEELIEPYSDSSVGGVGGLVYDHTGAKLQYKYSACYRRGETTYAINPPFDNLVSKGADPFLYIQGTNCSFRREVLAAVGGFNEQIEYYHDETDVCMRIIDLGYRIESLNKASVIHRYAKSHVRDLKRIVYDPYTTVKNQHLFAIQNGKLSQSMQQIYSSLGYYTELVREGARWHFKQGNFTAAQLNFFLDQVSKAVKDGVKAGYTPRLNGNFRAPADIPKSFHSNNDAPMRRLNIVYITQELPPKNIGGIGRFTLDLATEMAAKGHVVHIITRGDENSIDFRQGVYIHNIKYEQPSQRALEITPVAWTLAHLFSVFNYINAMALRFEVDIISGPIWQGEALFCHLAKSWPTVLTLHTTMKTVGDLHPEEAVRPEVQALIGIEKLAYRNADLIQANSNAVLQKTMEDYGSRENFFTVPHGISPTKNIDLLPFKKDKKEIVVLFVGRLELRKGVDILLEAIEILYPLHQKASDLDIKFVLAGPLSQNTGHESDFSEWFAARRNDLVSQGRVQFTGEVSSEDLEALYRDADIFVLPSRFESFGLVILEAMRYGVPIIASGSSGMSEVVNDLYGRLFPPGDASALAQSIAMIASDPKLRAELGLGALKTVETTFNIDTISTQICSEYYPLIENHKNKSKRSSNSEILDFVSGIAQAVSCTFREAQDLVSELYRPINVVTRLDSLLRSMNSDSDYSFYNKCYQLILGRNYENDLKESEAAATLEDHGGRAQFISSMLRSAEARSSAFSIELLDYWNSNISKGSHL